MNITFVIPSLNAGGSERVLVTLANELSNNGYSVSILIYTHSNIKAFYSIDEKIKLNFLNISHESSFFLMSIFQAIYRVYKIRDYFKKNKTDVVISFCTETNVEVLLATRFLDNQVIVSERSNPKIYPYKKILKILRFFTYHLADNIVLQTHAVKKYFKKFANADVIPNPVLVGNYEIEQCISYDLPKPFIVAVGRLSKEKNFDVLIRVFSILSVKYPEWSLVFVGEGGYKKELINLIDEYKLNDKVHLLGEKKEPQFIMRHANMFVLCSKFEGFPNVLCEAMSVGLPVIAYDCEFGPSDIIQHNVNGLLVQNQNVNKMIETIEYLIQNPEIRQRLGEKARSIVNDLSIDKIVLKWENLFIKNKNLRFNE